MAQGSLFSMRQLTAKTGSKAAQSVAAIGGASSAFSTRPWPTQSSINDAKASSSKIGLAQPFGKEQNNQQKSESGEHGQENPKAKWYQGKTFKGVVAGGVGAAVSNAYKYKKVQPVEKEAADKQKKDEENDENDIHPAEEVFLKSVDVKEVDPDLYTVFLRIKKDMGVMEDIHFRILIDDYNNILASDSLGYSFMHCCVDDNDNATSATNILLLNKCCYGLPKAMIIQTIAHELEHFRQYHKYIGSYHPSIRIRKDKDILRVETGADAAAAGYLDCPECLKDCAKNKFPHEPHETEFGCFSSPNGYFSKEDFDPYIERAKCEGVACRAHRDGAYEAAPLEHYLPDVN